MGLLKSLLNSKAREKTYDVWLKHVYGLPGEEPCPNCAPEWFRATERAKQLAPPPNEVMHRLGLVTYKREKDRLLKEGYPEGAGGRIAAEHANALQQGLDWFVSLNLAQLCDTGASLWGKSREASKPPIDAGYPKDYSR